MLTPSIPERKALLRECEASVRAQTTSRWEHLIEIDRERAGCSATMNRLAREAQAPWLLPLADDDVILPRCLELLLSHAVGADVVYAPPLVWGRPPEAFLGEPPRIPSFALIRRSLWFELGGYEEGIVREEDRRLWVAAMGRGARFVRADSEPTWIYRHHNGNKSFNAGVAA